MIYTIGPNDSVSAWAFPLISTGIVAAAALYLMLLGTTALINPKAAKRFLGRLATTRRVHFMELVLRCATGLALVARAPGLAFGPALRILGGILVVTSLILAIVPWRFHQRFAAWSVPQATQHIKLIGVSALLGGVLLLAAMLLPRAPA